MTGGPHFLEIPDDFGEQFYEAMSQRHRCIPSRSREVPEPGRCGSCGQFVGDGAIICRSCDVAERRSDFEAMLP